MIFQGKEEIIITKENKKKMHPFENKKENVLFIRLHNHHMTHHIICYSTGQKLPIE